MLGPALIVVEACFCQSRGQSVYSSMMLSFIRRLRGSGLRLSQNSTLKVLRGITSTVVTTLGTDDVNKEENSILINWNKEKDSWSKYHFDWLRDNCSCTKCKHPGFNQRLLNTLEDATPANLVVEDSATGVEVEWRDGHRSQYSYEWLLANSYCHNNISKPVKPGEEIKKEITLWDHKTMVDPPKVDYNDMMKNDGSLLIMLRAIYRYGFCFILDAPVTKESMTAAGERVGPFKNSYYGHQWYMETTSHKKDHVSFGKGRVLPHTDDPVFFEPPGLTWLHVLTYENAEGAGSKIIDAFSLASYIMQHNPEYYSLLCKVSIPYNIIFKDATYGIRKNTFILDDSDELTAIALNHNDRKPLDEKSLLEAKTTLSCNSDEAMMKMYLALRHLHQLLYSDQFAYRCDLRPGTMVVVNNWRIFHARDALIKGYRSVCGMHHNREDWMSKLIILEGTH